MLLTWTIPSFTPTTETEPIQSKGGMSIGATPVVYDKKIQEKQSERAYDPRPGLDYTNPAKYFLRGYTPTVSVSPSQIAFTLTIVNNLDRVFRSAGAVISLNVDGKAIAFDQSGIKELLDVVLVPRAQAQVTIWGPSLSVRQKSGTIALFVYDVVTELDAAGNPTKKENYTWYYEYAMDSHSESVPHRIRDNLSQKPGNQVGKRRPCCYSKRRLSRDLTCRTC